MNYRIKFVIEKKVIPKKLSGKFYIRKRFESNVNEWLNKILLQFSATEVQWHMAAMLPYTTLKMARSFGNTHTTLIFRCHRSLHQWGCD
jgi:hypothetical protein